MVTTPNANTDEILIWSDVLDRLACREKKAKKNDYIRKKNRRIESIARRNCVFFAAQYIELNYNLDDRWKSCHECHSRLKIGESTFNQGGFRGCLRIGFPRETIGVPMKIFSFFFQNEISTRSIDSMDQWITYFSCILSYINIQVNNCFHRKRENSILGRKITSLD